MQETVIKIDNLKKQYRLGTIGGGTLTHDLQSWWARKRGKEDPNIRLDEIRPDVGINETFWALKGINLEVKKGEALGIIGSNGAGKSTLLKLLSRVTAPTEGEIKIKGRIASMLEVGTGFHGELTGRENIYMNGAILGMSRKEVDQKIEQIIDFSECRQFIDTPVKRYSSGMYVKLAFAVAAHLDAEILVMDEVLAVGDMKFQKKCLGKMGDAANNEGRTVLYVSHNMNTIRQLCTRCIVLNKGEIIYDGDVDEAIQIYMDEENGELLTDYELFNAPRRSMDLGKKVKLNKFTFLNKDKAIFEQEETIKFQLVVNSIEEIKNLRVQAILRYADTTIAGMTLTKEGIDLEGGKTYKINFEYDISNLAEGIYFFTPILCVFNELGIREIYDVSPQKIFISIYSKNSERYIQWNRQYWGNVWLNNIIQIGEPQLYNNLENHK